MNRKAMIPLAAALTVAMVMSSVTVRASEMDEKVESSFKKTYVYKTYLADDSIRAEAKDGVVTLTGTVSEESHKGLAQETVVNLPGVTRVDNQLVTKAEAAVANADAWISKKVKFALLVHRNVSYSKTTVEVKDGIVTLKGDAINAAQKELSSEYAKDIDGVKEVKNEMTVAVAAAVVERTEGEKVDDASITAQVKTALWNHHSTSSMKTTVITRNGEVTLTGIAKNDAEKSLVTKLVSDIRGVSGVKNDMTVAAVKTE